MLQLIYWQHQHQRKKFYKINTCGLYYKPITIVNGD